MQNFHPHLEKLRRNQEQQLSIWSTGIGLLSSIIDYKLINITESLHGRVFVKNFHDYLDLEDFLAVCSGRSITGGWSFILNLDIPGLPHFERLAYIQSRSPRMHQKMGYEGGPSLFWSCPNPDGYPKWKREGVDSPFAVEITMKLGSGDEWTVLLPDDSFLELNTTELAEKISSSIMAKLSM